MGRARPHEPDTQCVVCIWVNIQHADAYCVEPVYYIVICLLLAAQVKIIVHTLNCVCILTAAHIECRLSQKIAVLERNDFVCVIFSYFVIDFRANILSSA